MEDSEKIRKVTEEIVEPLKEDIGNTLLKSICALPENITFTGKKKNEHVILIARRDPAALVWNFLLLGLLVISPIFFIGVVRAMGFEGGSLLSFSIGVSILFAILAFTYIVDLFVKWFYTVSIITDKRIVDLDFTNVMYHRYSEASLAQIEDVSHSVKGLWGSIFDYGLVDIQTAATRPEFEFQDVPKPRAIQEVLLNLMHRKERGDI